MKIITKPKEWGNSLGLIIPKKVAKKEKITLDTNIIVDIKKVNPVKEVFGTLRGWKIDTQKFKDEIRKEEYLAEKRKWGD